MRRAPAAGMNDEQRLIEALITRAEDDAEAFRRKHRGETPTERWIENSYTAALPLAKDHAGIDPGPGPHPTLFSAYRGRIGEILGERPDVRDPNDGGRAESRGEN